jgi:transcriptional regulator with XRE-family HTH domain
MAPNTPTPQLQKPGDRLRKIRSQLGMTAREVEELSRTIALQQGNEEFTISHGRIIQVENDESTPSIYKLFSLSAIYGMTLTDMLRLFVDLDGLSQYRGNLKKDQTRLMQVDVDQGGRPMTFPVRFDPGFNVDRTSLLSRMVQVWGEIPVALFQQVNLRSMQYGLIGLNDFTMYPLVKPGSFVQIDDTQRKVVTAPTATSEYERPIYFIELRDRYLCGWCEVQKGQLVVIPHPLSPCKLQLFAHPTEAEIVGRVVAIAARIAPIREQQIKEQQASAPVAAKSEPPGSQSSG